MLRASKVIRSTKQILRSHVLEAPKRKDIYREYQALSNLNILKTADIAVVIHLYYTDKWPLFVKKMRNLNTHQFDLFISLTEQSKDFILTIKETYPDAHVFVVPNIGRDVLPFIMLGKQLLKYHYQYVLKFHSKKSTHRTDGQDWLEGMLGDLVPDDKGTMDNIIKVLQRSHTGIVGPSKVYYPLSINFPANGEHMMQIVKKIYNKDIAHEVLQANRSHYGFFGGTMFWARMDAIQQLFNVSSIANFELEIGQIDGTAAHALERLFTIIPEIEKRKIFEVIEKAVIDRPYTSDNIPGWSEDHDK